MALITGAIIAQHWSVFFAFSSLELLLLRHARGQSSFRYKNCTTATTTVARRCVDFQLAPTLSLALHQLLLSPLVVAVLVVLLAAPKGPSTTTSFLLPYLQQKEKCSSKREIARVSRNMFHRVEKVY